MPGWRSTVTDRSRMPTARSPPELREAPQRLPINGLDAAAGIAAGVDLYAFFRGLTGAHFVGHGNGLVTGQGKNGREGKQENGGPKTFHAGDHTTHTGFFEETGSGPPNASTLRVLVAGFSVRVSFLEK